MIDKIKKSFMALPIAVVFFLVVAFWIARAPTSYNGKVPFVGDIFPIELNAVYLIVFGPIVAVIATGIIWVFIANGAGTDPATRLLASRRNETILLMSTFALLVIFCTLLSLQYFLILAPENLCPSRPHFEFLWTSVPGKQQIYHCMSGMGEINKKSPYYIEPQIVQSWGHVAWPLLTLAFLVGASLAWFRQGAGPHRGPA